jgi:hypothetical protein
MHAILDGDDENGLHPLHRPVDAHVAIPDEDYGEPNLKWLVRAGVVDWLRADSSANLRSRVTARRVAENRVLDLRC